VRRDVSMQPPSRVPRSGFTVRRMAQPAEQLAQVKVDLKSERSAERKHEPGTDAARVSGRVGESRSDAVGVTANVIVTPYVSSEMS
jgi:hypothetical protein